MKTSDRIITFVAIFISILALTVSIVQTRILQKQSFASVWPYLSNAQGHGPDYYISTVNNDGVGPAIITSVNYNYKDTSFHLINKLIHHFKDLEEIETGKEVRLDFTYSNIMKGSVLKPAEQVKVFIANDSTSVAIAKKYLSLTDIEMNYCSVYEDCWRMKEDKVIELN